MTPDIKKKIAKIYELVKRGTDGEQRAAKAALDKIISKYNLNGDDIDELIKTEYSFKYSWIIESWLVIQIVRVLTNVNDDKLQNVTRTVGMVKEVRISLSYTDYVIVSCAYEYFRRHMKAQFNKVCGPAINACRKAKTRKKKRIELEELFYEQYTIASGLYKNEWLQKIDDNELSDQEMKNRIMMAGIEGGSYNTQVQNGLMIEEHAT